MHVGLLGPPNALLPPRDTPPRPYGGPAPAVPAARGRLPVLGFRIEPKDSGPKDPGLSSSPFPLAYCTDVSAIPPESWRLLRGVKTLVLDALRPRHHPTHFTLDQAINVSQRIEAEQTYFIHMSHDLGHEATNAQLPEGMQLGRDGLIVG